MSYYNKPKEKKYWVVKKRCRWNCDLSSDCSDCRGKGWTLGWVYSIYEPHPSIVHPTVSYETVAKLESNYQKYLNRKGK
jgi:hypothetical protein